MTNYNVFPKEFSKYGEGFGRLKDRDFISKKEKLILLKRQHHKCAICQKMFTTDRPYEAGHILPKDKGGMLYDVSTVFPDAVLPNNALVCKRCNGLMGCQIDGMWAMEVAAYYGLGKISATDHELAKNIVKSNSVPPDNWPFWLVDEYGKLIFLTDMQFDEQAYFARQIATYEPFIETNGSLKPIGLGKSRF